MLPQYCHNSSHSCRVRVTRIFLRVNAQEEFQKKGVFMKYKQSISFRVVQLSLLLGLAASLALAQSGDISGSTSNFTMLGTSILKLVVALAGMGFVGLIIWGGLTLSTNRPRGLAMVGGGLAGALLAGLAFVLVNTLTG